MTRVKFWKQNSLVVVERGSLRLAKVYHASEKLNWLGDIIKNPIKYNLVSGGKIPWLLADWWKNFQISRVPLPPLEFAAFFHNLPDRMNSRINFSVINCCKFFVKVFKLKMSYGRWNDFKRRYWKQKAKSDLNIPSQIARKIFAFQLK